MAQRTRQFSLFDFLLRVTNVVFVGGCVFVGLLTAYAVGGQWIASAVADVPHWIVFSDMYAANLIGSIAGASVEYWWAAIPAVYGSAILVVRRIWY